MDWVKYQEMGVMGLLTPEGKRQLYVLGQYLREEYPDHYKDVYVRSTDVNRTIESARNLLFGMFDMGTPRLENENDNDPRLLPPIENIKGPKRFANPKRVPRKINTVPIHKDRILRSFTEKFCPKMA